VHAQWRWRSQDLDVKGEHKELVWEKVSPPPPRKGISESPQKTVRFWYENEMFWGVLATF